MAHEEHQWCLPPPPSAHSSNVYAEKVQRARKGFLCPILAMPFSHSQCSAYMKESLRSGGHSVLLGSFPHSPTNTTLHEPGVPPVLHTHASFVLCIPKLPRKYHGALVINGAKNRGTRNKVDFQAPII